MNKPEQWTVSRAWDARTADRHPMVAEWSRELAHQQFVRHADGPLPANIVWPSVVTSERIDGSTVVYEVRGKAFR